MTLSMVLNHNCFSYCKKMCKDVFCCQIWAGCRRESQLVVWDEKSTRKKEVLRPDCRGISVILVFGDKVSDCTIRKQVLLLGSGCFVLKTGWLVGLGSG